MMLFLHLFNRDYKGLFQPLLFIGSQPLSYYISLFCDACVPIFAFVSGYGLYLKYQQSHTECAKANFLRLKKLYINYWIIIILFAVLLGWLTGAPGYPGSWWKFLENISGMNGSYNSAWWFFTSYVFFVLTSSFWFKLMEKFKPVIMLSLLFVLYIVSFWFRVYQNDIFEHNLLQYVHRQSALYFCTLFQFVLGAYALKMDWHGWMTTMFSRLRYPSVAAVLGITALVVLHGLIPNFIIAPFTGLGFIFLFLQIKTGKLTDRALDYFTPHATNLWLVHMFFYLIYFKEFIYSFTFVPLIFAVLVLVSLISSYMINYIYHFVQKPS